MALNFNGNTPKKILYNGLNVAKLVFNGVVVWLAKVLTTITGYPITLTNSTGDDLVDYKIYGNSVQQGILPEEYQQVEYIESTGTQYIELDYIANQNTNSKGTFQITDTSIAGMLFGAREKSSTAKFYGFNWGGSKPYKYYNSYYTGQITEIETDTEKHTFSKKGGLLKIDDIEVSTNTPTVTEWNTIYDMIIFGCKTAGVAGLLSKARIFDLQFFEGEEVIYDLIPCYRKSDEAIGMYDLVNDVFYTNAGTGEFLKGNNMPTPETPIEIESVGDSSVNILNPDFSKASIGTYSYILLSNTPKVLTLRLIDRDTSVDITKVSFGFTGNGQNANNGFHWCVAGGGIREKFITNNKDNGNNSIENPLMYFSVYPKGQATWEAVFKRFYIQIVEGEYTENTIPEYEPYGYKIPVKLIPTIYDFRKNNIENLIYNASGNTRYGFDLGVLEEGDYTFDWVYENEFPTYIYLREKTIEGTFATIHIAKGVSEKPITPLTFKANGTSNFYIILASATIDTLEKAHIHWEKAKNAYLQKGTEIQIQTTKIYIDEPLRKTENYVDYIDFEKNKLIRPIINKVLDGTEEWEIHTTTDEGAVFRLDGALTPLIGASIYDTHMTHFSLTEIYSTATFTNGLYRFSYNQNNLTISGDRLYISAKQTTVEDFKSWLSENKPSIIYPLATLIEEDIELPTIPTNEGTNIIEIDTTINPSNMEVVYYKK